MHGHGFSCEKGNTGKYMCWLVFKRGLHNGKTCPLLVTLYRSENVEKKRKEKKRKEKKRKEKQTYRVSPWMNTQKINEDSN